MSNISIKKEFHDFGKYIQVVAILTIVGITTGMAGFVAMIFIFIAIGSLKRANNILNNSSLQQFRSKYIKGVISRICGMVILIIGGVNIALFYFFSSPFPIYISLPIPVVLIISGIVLIYVGVAAEMKAWKNLKAFFENNYKMFPANMSEDAIEGCNQLRKGTLLSSLWFLVIPVIIGFIYQVKGYFNLATFNKLSTYEVPEPIEVQADLPVLEPIKDSDRKINFCPNCGAKLSEIGNFCAHCGSELR
jgi:uncharacterized protein YacL